MSSEYNKMFRAGDRLILELKSKDIFEGIYADGGRDRIVLAETIQHNNNNKLGGLDEFYRNEISKIHSYKPPPSKEEKREENEHSKPNFNCKFVKVCQDEYFRLKEMSQNYVYLEKADKRYFEAVKILNDSETVGVAALGMEKHRSAFIQLLVLCTWKQVYIFDLANLHKRELYPEIKELFESEHVCKVIHKSAGLADILYREYKVYMQNTFDTQIVDLLLQKKETGACLPIERDISDCLQHYLNFPSCFLDRALSVSNKKWNERPLSDKTKVYASQLVTYLILLKDYFQKLFLKDIFNTIDKVQDKVYAMDDFKFLDYNSNKQVPKDVQDLIPNLAKLSVEDNRNFQS